MLYKLYSGFFNDCQDVFKKDRGTFFICNGNLYGVISHFKGLVENDDIKKNKIVTLKIMSINITLEFFHNYIYIV